MAEPSCSSSTKPLSSVMFWTKDHDVILCREVVNRNPYTTKKGSTQRSTIWEKVATALNNCSHPVFIVDKRSVRDHIGILINRRKKKLRAEEKATGITPDEPTELDNLIEQLIALEESAEAEQQEMDREKNQKLESDRAKAEDVRFKAMEKLSDTQKRQSGEEDNQSKRPRRSSGDAMSYLSERAELNYGLKQEELKLKKDQQEQQSQLLKVVLQQQQQQQQQSQQTLLMMQQQQQQTKALMGILERIMDK